MLSLMETPKKLWETCTRRVDAEEATQQWKTLNLVKMQMTRMRSLALKCMEEACRGECIYDFACFSLPVVLRSFV